MKYIAFLKGVNVSGQKATRIQDWNHMFKKLGLEKVSTNIESGNVLFESDKPGLSDLLEEQIKANLGYNVTVLLKSVEEVKEMMNQNPFKEVEGRSDVKTYITFLNSKPTNEYILPIISSMKDVEVIQVSKGIALSTVVEVNGNYYNPNSFIERELGVLAATRNWTTISKILSQKVKASR